MGNLGGRVIKRGSERIYKIFRNIGYWFKIISFVYGHQDHCH